MAAPTPDDQIHGFFDRASKGFFAEVGVRKPAASATAPLETAGWNGALIEPQPDVAAFLVTARKARVFAVACVAPDEAGAPLALRIDSPLAAIDVGRPFGRPPSDYVIMVPTRTLDDVLGEAEAPAPFDLLWLDIHGHELDALLGFDFERWRPKLIVIADPAIDLQRHRFLKESGYRAIRRAGGCGWYVPADAPVSSKRWAILRDYYLLLPFRKAWHLLRRLNARIMATAD